MSLVHEQDLALARGKPPDEFVVVRGFVPRLIDVATEDLRRLRIFELIGVPELVIILLVDRVWFDLLREELSRSAVARRCALPQCFPGEEYGGQRQSLDAEPGRQTLTFAPCLTQREVQQLLRRRVVGAKLAQCTTMAYLASRRLQKLAMVRRDGPVECIAVGERGIALMRCSPSHRCQFSIAAELNLVFQSRLKGLDGRQVARGHFRRLAGWKMTYLTPILVLHDPIIERVVRNDID